MAELGFHQFKKEAKVETFPKDFSDYIKSKGSRYFWAKGNFHVLTKAQDAMEALKNPVISCDRTSFFLSRMPNIDLSLLQDFFAVVAKMMVMSDGKEHKQRRFVANKGLSEKLIADYTKKIKPHVHDLITKGRQEDSIEFFSKVSSKLPSIVLADLFCIPETDRDKFYEWSGTMTGFFGGGSNYENTDAIRVNKAAKNLKEYFQNLLEKRKKKPEKDFFTGMLEASGRFDLSDSELISQAVMMLVAGQVTTADQINNILFLLMTNPGVYQKISQDNSLIHFLFLDLKKFYCPLSRVEKALVYSHLQTTISLKSIHSKPKKVINKFSIRNP